MKPHEPEQLDLLTALDENEGLDPWIYTLPCPPWASEPPSPADVPEMPRAEAGQ